MVPKTLKEMLCELYTPDKPLELTSNPEFGFGRVAWEARRAVEEFIQDSKPKLNE